MKICFDLEDFKKYMEMLIIDECSGYLTVEEGIIIDNWESNINGIITKHRSIMLKGEIIDE